MTERRASFTSWRGTVGVIEPTFRPGALEDFIRLLPDGVAVIPLFIGVREGTGNEFRKALPAIEERVHELSEIGVDLIYAEGAPPFMVHGRERERDVVDGWGGKYGVPVVTASMMHVESMRALGMRRVVGITYLPRDLNEMFVNYFEEAGFEVLSMDGIDVPFDQVGNLSSHQVYAFARSNYLKHPEADGIYMLGSGWRVLDIIEPLEQDLGVPVVQSTAARVWAVQGFLHVRQPVLGYGRLLAEMPVSLQEGH
ncbi:MAG: hypothetical protein WEB67_11345 [Acidimicrobiia bacterium]